MSEYKSLFVYEQSLYERMIEQYGEEVFTSENNVLSEDQKSIFENRKNALENPNDPSIRLSINDLNWLNDSELDFVIEFEKTKHLYFVNPSPIDNMYQSTVRGDSYVETIRDVIIRQWCALAKGNRGNVYINCLKKYYDYVGKDDKDMFIFELIKNNAPMFLILSISVFASTVYMKKTLLIESLSNMNDVEPDSKTHKICNYVFADNIIIKTPTEQKESDDVLNVYHSYLEIVGHTTMLSKGHRLFFDWLCSILSPLSEELINTIVSSRLIYGNFEKLWRIAKKHSGITNEEFDRRHPTVERYGILYPLGINGINVPVFPAENIAIGYNIIR